MTDKTDEYKVLNKYIVGIPNKQIKELIHIQNSKQ